MTAFPLWPSRASAEERTALCQALVPLAAALVARARPSRTRSRVLPGIVGSPPGRKPPAEAENACKQVPRLPRSGARLLEGRVACGSESRKDWAAVGPPGWVSVPAPGGESSVLRGFLEGAIGVEPATAWTTTRYRGFGPGRVCFVEPSGVGEVSPVAQIGATIGTPARVQCANDAPSQTIASDPMKTRASSACSCGRRMCQTTRAATTGTSASLTWSVPFPH
jgi:hypothetical protein